MAELVGSDVVGGGDAREGSKVDSNGVDAGAMQ
jgi:hypothetical protein